MPTFGRRRVPGLRREELAQLAGMSADYYMRLEQGRCGNVSEEVLDALARELRLDADERTYLYNLVKPVRGRVRTTHTVVPHLRYLLDSMDSTPAYVIDHRVDILAWNRMAAALIFDFGELPADRRNWLLLCFLDDRVRDIFPDWERKARDTVAIVRLNAARFPDDARLTALIGELSVKSELFRQWWADLNVREKTYGTKRFTHPLAGEMTLHFQTFGVAGRSDQSLVAYAAEPGTAAARGLSLLASWTLAERLAPDREHDDDERDHHAGIADRAEP
ncbi:DNA-binding protein [Microtetraspora sp. NBRC 13810]|nr:DNA-binding protein [Microtetraspora sp. NBRC 13810]